MSMIKLNRFGKAALFAALIPQVFASLSKATDSCRLENLFSETIDRSTSGNCDFKFSPLLIKKPVAAVDKSVERDLLEKGFVIVGSGVMRLPVVWLKDRVQYGDDLNTGAVPWADLTDRVHEIEELSRSVRPLLEKISEAMDGLRDGINYGEYLFVTRGAVLFTNGLHPEVERILAGATREQLWAIGWVPDGSVISTSFSREIPSVGPGIYLFFVHEEARNSGEGYYYQILPNGVILRSKGKDMLETICDSAASFINASHFALEPGFIYNQQDFASMFWVPSDKCKSLKYFRGLKRKPQSGS
jgi:hypothetical protein